jgi:UDP-N-acetyl-D-galactosamine dehydrogenase
MKVKLKVSIIGLGYVGLPLALLCSKKHNVVGFDINKQLINNLNNGVDHTNEINSNDLKDNKNFLITDDVNNIEGSDFFIITVPTPVDKFNVPDLESVKSASQIVSPFLKKGSTVIYESTFFPGCTTEICLPILKKNTKLKFNKDFFCGYSPERINPGDKIHTLQNTVKLISGSSTKSMNLIKYLYKSIGIKTFDCDSIEIAEAAKVIENVQRDVNIALVNEFALIFKRFNLNTTKVLEAASTKWNFLNFKPGLVGGHCIGVDPYYLTYKAQGVNYAPQVILSGRRINDNMGRYVAREVIKMMNLNNFIPKKTKIIIFGLTFKENCPDVRNSQVVQIFYELYNFGYKANIYDPYIKDHEDKLINNNLIFDINEVKNYNVAIFAVSHKEFKKFTLSKLNSILMGKNSIIYDVKSIFFNKNISNQFHYNSL